MIDYEALEDTYLHKDFSYDEDEMDFLKEKVRRLPEVDKRVLILYAHFNSLRKVAKILGVSHQTIKYKISDIRKKIKGEN